MNAEQVNEFFNILEQNKGDIELDHTNNYTLLVAVILSARMTDKGVNKATKELFKIVGTPEDMLQLGEEKLLYHIKTIGLYKTKAVNVMKMSKILVDKFDSQVPDELEALESLPGVGRKTANVMLTHAFHKSAFPVDTHVFRVCNRTGLAPGKTPVDVEKVLQRITPAKYALDASHCMVLHGRYICKSLQPLCTECPVKHLCEYYKNNSN